MRELPECLKRRYQALDDLMIELGEGMADDTTEPNDEASTNDPCIRLMCRFWDILKEDPYCDLREAVLQRMDSDTQAGSFGPQEIACYNFTQDKTRDVVDKIQTICCKITTDQDRENSATKGCGQKKPAAGAPKVGCCDPKKSPSASLRGSDILPLSKVLCNLQNAASFDKKCSLKINALADVQKQVQTQIQSLEEREKQGTELLKQADCMWTCMEDTYKKKISDSIQKQKNLLKEQREVEGSLSKWRKNKKDLEQQMKHLEQCKKEIKEKTNQKNNDIKSINAEINDYKKRIETNNKDIEAAKKSLNGKKQASNNKMSQLAQEFKKLQDVVSKEEKLKKDKEDEGNKYIKEARNDLATICRVLLQKKLENEDLRAEINAIMGEIDLLKTQSDQCKDRCKTKQQNMADELKKVSEDLANYKVRCIRCHKCVDSADVRRFCTDCPRCHEIRECLYGDGVCTEDPTTACVCMSVKHKFLDNVFENMYTILERQVKTRPGKVLAEQVLSCLKKSRNGKLNDETRKALQDFVLATVKKNLNLTIIGGAVKTRCEMDSDTYKQLMLCLAQITVTKVKADKVDKGTPARKDPCRRWGGTGECNCPGGPKLCICSAKAPPPPKDPAPCPRLAEDKEDIGKANVCPHQKDPIECGPDCANAKVPDEVQNLLNTWKPEPCGTQPGQSCNFSKNMRAAQCMLGPESLYSIGTPSKPKGYATTIPFGPNMSNMMALQCGCEPGKCTCGGIKQCKEVREIKKSKCPTILEHLEKTEPTPNNKKQKEFEKIPKRENKCDFKYKKINRFSTMEEDLRKSIETVKAKMVEGKDVPIVQAEVMSQAYQERGTNPHIALDTIEQQRIPLEQVVGSLIKQIASKELFKVAMLNKSGTLNHELTEITITSSGAMEMALDEKTIELIDNSTKENPNLFVVLKKTLSGHYVMKFNKDQSVSSDSQKILVKRNGSGQMTLEVHKNIINTIQPDIMHSKGAKKLSQTSTFPIELTKKVNHYECNQQPLALTEEEEKITYSAAKSTALGIKQIEVKEGFGVLRYGSKDSEKYADQEGGVRYDKKSEPIENFDFTKIKADVKELDKTKRSLYKSSNQNIEQVDNNYNKKSSNIMNDIKKIATLGENIHKMLLNNETALDLKVVGESGLEIDLKANLTATNSGHIAVNMKDIANHSQMAEQLQENPVLLENKNSKYLLKVNPEKEMANATLRKTSSGGMYAVLKDSVLNQSDHEVIALKPHEISHKVRVKGAQRVHPDTTCSIRITASGNYEFVLDKEFGKQHMQIIDHSIGDDSESYVNLSKTESGCYLIDFDDNIDNSSDTNINALLVKSYSGNIKLFVKGSAFEAIETEIPTGQSSNVFGELFKKAPQSSRELHREHLAKSKFLDSKSCSDSHVYGKVRIHDQKSSLTGPPAILKKTISGQYTVVLNKDSKLSFINNLKNYISKSGRNLIPIKRTDGGDIIICLNQDHECKGHYGSLKITPSGNIYVFVEEKVIQDIEKNAVEDTAQTTTSELSSTSVHMIGTLVRPQNKAVTTTCDPKWDSTGCDKSKCVCNELVSEMNKWGYSLPEEKARGMGITWYQVVKSTDHGCKANNRSSFTESSKSSETESEQFSHSDNDSPKVGILRCTHPKQGTRQINNEQCFYVIDTDRANVNRKPITIPNDLIQIVGPCHHSNWKEEAEIKDYDFESHFVNDAKSNKKNDLSNLDYLELLPPQLPSFLRGSS
ncbi:uncharacterized protein isoform X1 [Choristoneura fumiferana]|uniref:uncharacterized protein isoform X1 n=2 Tax=Choristoneura fumiferana TaxID=7141 RepID=UPI003D15548E